MLSILILSVGIIFKTSISIALFITFLTDLVNILEIIVLLIKETTTMVFKSRAMKETHLPCHNRTIQYTHL